MSVEIACDESGWEGETLVTGNNAVFAHASVNLSLTAAAECIQEARDRIGSPAEEYKAGHFLRPQNRAVLLWLLAPGGPIYDRASVYLIDKTHWLLSRLVNWAGDEGADLPAAVYRDGATTVEPTLWRRFLASGNELLRAKSRRGIHAPVRGFYTVVDELRGTINGEGPLHELLIRLHEKRELAPLLRTEAIDNPRPASIDPMIAAVTATVAHWSELGQDVRLVHDEQSALTPERIADLKMLFNGPGGRLSDVVLVDSLTDPRVQVADFLAGVARKIAEDDLAGEGDIELTRHLRPYLDTMTVWPERESWRRLADDV